MSRLYMLEGIMVVGLLSGCNLLSQQVGQTEGQRGVGMEKGEEGVVEKEGGAMMEGEEGRGEVMMENESGKIGDGVEKREYELVEVEEHDVVDDCWLAVEGKVYDVTEYITGQKHPGGVAILEGCGKDAKELYDTRPMGSGTAHSDRARDMLENFYIGDLVL